MQSVQMTSISTLRTAYYRGFALGGLSDIKPIRFRNSQFRRKIANYSGLEGKIIHALHFQTSENEQLLGNQGFDAMKDIICVLYGVDNIRKPRKKIKYSHDILNKISFLTVKQR